jgi:DNA-binding transcriptional LysR family regulator
MQDLNDLFIFSQVVENNGFTGAARAMGVARSSICRRVGQLEERLGIRLVQRSTRRFAVTDLGMEFHGYCVKMVAEGKAAYERMALARARPSGLIRVSCPPVIAQVLVPLIPLFVEKNPDVRIAVEAINRNVSIEDNFDLSIRVQQVPSRDSGMIMRSLGIVQQVLVASPGFLERYGRPTSPAEAACLPSIGYGSYQAQHLWKLVDRDEQQVQVHHEPKLITDDMLLVRQAVVDGVGIAQLPLAVCLNELRQGLIELILPEFLAPLCEIQVVFPSRHGMLPAVRSFIDFLSAHCVSEVAERQIKRHTGQGSRQKPPFWTSRQPVKQLVGSAPRSVELSREARVA